jgi:hypothetical protein
MQSGIVQIVDNPEQVKELQQTRGINIFNVIHLKRNTEKEKQELSNLHKLVANRRKLWEEAKEKQAEVAALVEKRNALLDMAITKREKWMFEHQWVSDFAVVLDTEEEYANR